ncbi:MAG: alpha-amylase [Bacteroidetes bacterium]|nr:alpha-amylase [Bacteroidota bacterium]MBU1719286.1 alpha-amylase [Bacteroidota bacterium]
MKLPILMLLSSLIFWTSCRKKETSTPPRIPEKSDITGLAGPIRLNPDTTIIFTEDFFNDPSKITGISADTGISVSISADKKTVTIISGRKTEWLSHLRISQDDGDYDFLLMKSMKEKARLKFKPGKKEITEVAIAGEMNNWNPKSSPMKKDGNSWEASFMLNPGKYQYQVVADGKWMLDPMNRDSADNNNGGYNSVLTVGDPSHKIPHIRTDNTDGYQITITSEDTIKRWFVFWNNHLLTGDEIIPESSAKTIRFNIPGFASTPARSWIRVFAYSRKAAVNDLLIPLEKGKVVADASQMLRSDKETNIMYFMMTDRFFDSNPSESNSVNDPEVPAIADYMGGDLAGITTKLSDNYFTELGITALWISPIVQNPLKAYREYIPPQRKYSGYHGYWPISSTMIDTRFGTDSDLSELIKAAHDQQINVFLDYVANHVHEDHPMIKAHPDWKTALLLPDGQQNIRLWDEERLTTWFDTFLPSLDFSKPEVIEAVSDSALFWVKKFGIDGFRHDATKHIPEAFWRRLTQKLKQEYEIPQGKLLYQIGETFGSRELIGSYISNGMLDAQFDFNLYFDQRAVFAQDNVSFKKLDYSLKESLAWYGFHHLMGNITGNHDLPRFISYAGEGLSFTEDAKEAGWTRKIVLKNPEAGYSKLKSMTAFLMTIPGIPVIYSGDEIGMPGAGDPDNRQMMRFTALTPGEQSVKVNAALLTKLRRSRMELLYGDFTTLLVSDSLYAHSRSYFGKTTIVVFNKGKSEAAVKFRLPESLSSSAFVALHKMPFTMKSGKLEISIPGYGYEILSTP